MPVSDEAFKKVADLIGDKNTPVARRSTKAEQLQLYGLYKRATVDSSQRSATRYVFYQSSSLLKRMNLLHHKYSNESKNNVQNIWQTRYFES
jgi:hypothetical protein